MSFSVVKLVKRRTGPVEATSTTVILDPPFARWDSVNFTLLRILLAGALRARPAKLLN